MLDMSRVTALGTFRCSAIFCLVPHFGLRFGGLLLSFWKLGLNIRCLVSLAQRRLILGPDLLRAQHTHHTMPFYTILYHTIPGHTIPYCATLYHTIPYSSRVTLPNHTVPYHTILCHTMSYLAIPYHTVLYQTILCQTIPYHTVSHNAPYHTGSYHTAENNQTLLYCTLT